MGKMRMEIDSPWFKGETEGELGFIKQAKSQLEYFLERRSTPDPKKCKKDIEGYQIVIDSGSEKNASNFLAFKMASRQGKEEAVKDNVHVVEILKRRGVWEDSPTANT